MEREREAEKLTQLSEQPIPGLNPRTLKSGPEPKPRVDAKLTVPPMCPKFDKHFDKKDGQ